MRNHVWQALSKWKDTAPTGWSDRDSCLLVSPFNYTLTFVLPLSTPQSKQSARRTASCVSTTHCVLTTRPPCTDTHGASVPDIVANTLEDIFKSRFRKDLGNKCRGICDRQGSHLNHEETNVASACSCRSAVAPIISAAQGRISDFLATKTQPYYALSGQDLLRWI